MNTQIDITENGTTTLATAGKYCDRNIDVNVDVAGSSGGTEIEDALIEGTLSGHYRNDRITSLKNYALSGCPISSVELPNVTSTGSHAFSGTKITTINLPLVKTLAQGLVNQCRELQSASFPIATSMQSQVFSMCSELTDAYIPLVKELGSGGFSSCYRLKTLDLPSVTKINSTVFNENRSLTTLILRSTSLCTLGNVSAFNNCNHILGTVHTTYNPNGLKDGFIYVPANLVEQYRTATNWATYASQMMPLVATVADLASIDTTVSNHACVSSEYRIYTEYYFNGTEWEVFER